MSRPFSYNDKNFTVIGNLLIVHVAFTGKLIRNDPICNVPPGIYERIKYRGFVGSYNRSPYSPSTALLFVQDYVLHTTTPGDFTNGEFFAIVDLKNI